MNCLILFHANESSQQPESKHGLHSTNGDYCTSDKDDEKVTTTQVTDVVHQTATPLNLLPKQELKYELKEQEKLDGTCNTIVLFDHNTNQKK